MVERERSYAILRALGVFNEAVEQAKATLTAELGQHILEELYRFRVRRESIEELLEGIRESMGLSEDSELLHLLRGGQRIEASGNRRG